MEIEGDLSVEYATKDVEWPDTFIALSDGTVLMVTLPWHPDGWEIQRLVAGKSELSISKNGEDDSAVLVQEEPFLWAVIGVQFTGEGWRLNA